MSISFAAISNDLANVDANTKQIASQSQPELAELAYAVHMLTRCVEQLLGQLTTLKFEVASLRLANSESEPERG